MDSSISEDWVKWMTKIHIPDVMKSRCFQMAQINKVISEKEESITYAVQYLCKSIKDLHKYQVYYADKLQKNHTDQYGDKVVAFRTLLEVIESFD